MSPKIYTQEFKDAVVKYYERNHTIQETKEHFKVSESSLFAWKKEYNESHHLSVGGQRTTSNYMQKQRHLKTLLSDFSVGSVREWYISVDKQKSHRQTD